MADAILVATLETTRLPVEAQLALMPASVSWVEVRGDRVGDLEPAAWRRAFAGQWLYTLGGPAPARRHRLRRAAERYDLVTLESPHDLRPEVLDAVPPERRLLLWRGPAHDLADLRAHFDAMAAVPARCYKLVVEARDVTDGLLPLQLLQALGRDDVVAYADGSPGFWSRMLAPYLGAPFVFGTLADVPAEASEPALSRLIQDYGLPALPPLEAVYGIVGHPVAHSLSPRMHNAAYRQHGLPARYVPFETYAFDRFWAGLVESRALEALGWPLRGLTVVSPFKEMAQQMPLVHSPETERSCSSNLFIRQNGRWHAETTDPIGALQPLRDRGVQVAGAQAAIVGCGGSGRAIAAALDQAGARVTLVNRSPARGEAAEAMLGLPFVPLADFSAERFDVVVNATPVGRDGQEPPFPAETLAPHAAVIDLVYGTKPTPLVARAHAQGQVVIEGRDVLLVQVRRQFGLMTGHEMPEAAARATIGFAPREAAGTPR